MPGCGHIAKPTLRAIFRRMRRRLLLSLRRGGAIDHDDSAGAANERLCVAWRPGGSLTRGYRDYRCTAACGLLAACGAAASSAITFVQPSGVRGELNNPVNHAPRFFSLIFGSLNM
jgi:hypothetical protein